MSKIEEKVKSPVLEGNKLIAEFMGYRVFVKRYPRNHGIGAPEAEWKDCILEKTKYHSSWNHLMPVVEKIEGLGYSVEIIESYCQIDIKDIAARKGFKTFVFGGGDITKISSTFHSVVEFIKWYNVEGKESNK